MWKHYCQECRWNNCSLQVWPPREHSFDCPKYSVEPIEKDWIKKAVRCMSATRANDNTWWSANRRWIVSKFVHFWNKWWLVLKSASLTAKPNKNGRGRSHWANTTDLQSRTESWVYFGDIGKESPFISSDLCYTTDLYYQQGSKRPKSAQLWSTGGKLCFSGTTPDHARR